MKKNYFLMLFFTFLSFFSFGQSVIITGYVDSPCPSQNGRTLEMYVSGTVDFTDWNVVRQANGQGFTTDISLSDLGTISNAFVYVTNSAETLSAEFGISTNVLVSGSITDNGDDAFQIVNNASVVIDRFGEDGVDGSGTAWEHLDSFYYRKDGETANAGSFSATNWTFGSIDLLDNEGLCNSSNALSSFVPFGSYSPIASTNPEVSLAGNIDSLDYFEGNGPSSEDNFTVSGSNLTTNITVTAPANFQISRTSGSGFGNSLTLTQSGGTVNATTIYIRLSAGLAENTYSGNITTSSSGASSKSLAVGGIVSPADPQLTVFFSINDLNYTFNGGPSNEGTVTVSGLFLASNVVLTASTNFEVSTTSGAGFGSSVTLTPNSGTLETTTVYVRLASGLSIDSYSGDISFTVTGVTQNDIFLNGNVFGEPTDSLIITGIYDASLTGGTPKGIELYAINNIADLSLFGVSSVANGGGSSAGNVEYNFPADAVAAGTYIYLSFEDTNFNPFFGFNPTYTDGVVGINGDDAIELYENGQIIDTFGDVNQDGTGMTWEYTDGWAYRKNVSGPQGTNFTATNWIYSSPDAFDTFTTNASADNPFPLGTYVVGTASIIENNIEGFAAYPNPVTNASFTLKSASANEKQITIFSILGEKVLSKKVSGSNATVNVASLSSGIYTLKVVEDTKTAIQRLIIK